MLKNALWLFVVSFLVLAVFLPSYTKLSDVRGRNEQYDRELIELKKKNALLKHEKKLLEENPDYLEKVARDKMGLVREGEVVYRLTPMNAADMKKSTPKLTKPAPKKTVTKSSSSSASD